MATDLNRLKVSLTKHGAHKVAYLIEQFPPNEVHENVWDEFNNIKIDLAQTKGNLSLDANYVAPEIWEKIKEYGREDIFDLTFLAIVFSHHTLIQTMRTAFQNSCIIERGVTINGKAFTNFAHIIDELGYSIEHTADHIIFDISRIFYKFYLIEFIQSLLSIKLVEAKWDQTNSIVDECLNLGINEAFGLSPEDFTNWLGYSDIIVQPKAKAKRSFQKGLKFKEGHNPKMEDDIIAKPKTKIQKITLLHNKIQTRVFDILRAKFQNHEIGTEITSNAGSIDLVRKIDDKFVLYEIKTSNDSRSNIRQGLSQLLEYAYWKDKVKIEKLIIVGPVEADQESIDYIAFLRTEFKIPLYYQSYNFDNNLLGEEI